MQVNTVFVFTGTRQTDLSFRLLVDIQIGFLNAEVIPELTRYETESWVKYKWDTLQREYMCCGGYGQHQVLKISCHKMIWICPGVH